jgi:hypothetical protein
MNIYIRKFIATFRIIFPKYKNINIDYCKGFFNDDMNDKAPQFIYNLITATYLYITVKYFKKYFKIKCEEKTDYNSIYISIDDSIKYYNKINNIYKETTLFDLIIISSYADKTQNEFSDIDAIAIIKPLAFKNLKNFIKTKIKLTNLNNFYQNNDPLQHHGHWIFFQSEMQNYNQSIIPLCVIEKGVAIGRNLVLKYSISNDIENGNFCNILILQINSIESLYKDLFEKGLNLFDLKSLVSSISLCPPLIFQINGLFLRKDEAIRRSNEILQKDALVVIQFSTLMREYWHHLPIKIVYDKYRKKHKSNRKKMETIAKTDNKLFFLHDLPANVREKDFQNFINSVKTFIK